jgi:hypothetical protein
MHSSRHATSWPPRGRLATHHQPPTPLRDEYLGECGCDGFAFSEMSNNQQVINLTTGERMKLKRAKRKVEEGSMMWVVPFESVRAVTWQDLPDLKETRENHAKLEAPLETPEVAGITWEPPIAERSYTFLNNRRALLAEARQFAAQAIAQL